MEIISRAQWGAQYSAGAGPAPLPAKEVWLHHSATSAPDVLPPFDDEDLAMRQLEEIGQQRFGQGISYTWAAMPSGRIYEGHGVATLGAHTKNRNGIARAVVVVGNYNDYTLTDEQIENIAQLLVDEWRAGHLVTPKLNGGHRDVPHGTPTECPGRWAELRIPDINERAAELAALSPAHEPDEEDTFMSALTPDEQRRVLKFADDWAYLMPSIKEQTDRLQDEDAQTDALLWAVADPKEGLRIQLAAVQGQLAGLAAAMHSLTSGAGVDFNSLAKVAQDAASKAANAALAGLADRLRPTGPAPVAAPLALVSTPTIGAHAAELEAAPQEFIDADVASGRA